MTTVPGPLQKWKEQLSSLSPEAIELLAQWLPRISSWVGSYPRLKPHSTGEPAGYGDLSRKGGYEHLVTAEWLLADEHPEEFLRRAAHKEHLFYKLTRLESTIQKACFVLFDCGPTQLGKARLVQLALLIVLYQRSIHSQVSFKWQIIQDPGLVKDSLQTDDIRFFLASRSLRFADGQMVYGCLEHNELKTDQGTEKEIWIVGDTQSAHLATDTGCLHISIEELISGLDESVQGDLDQLKLKLGGPRHRSRTLFLDVPPEDSCVSLLRRPFKATALKKTSINYNQFKKMDGTDFLPVTDGSLFFSSSGRAMLAPTEHGAMLSYYIDPYSQPDAQKQITYFKPKSAELNIAVGYQKGNHYRIYVDPDGTYLQKIKKNKEKFNLRLGKHGALMAPDTRFGLSSIHIFYKSNEMLFWDGIKDVYCVPFGTEINLSQYKPIMYNMENYAIATFGALFHAQKEDSDHNEILLFDKVTNRVSSVTNYLNIDQLLPQPGTDIHLYGDMDNYLSLALTETGNTWHIYGITIHCNPNITDRIYHYDSGRIQVPHDQTVCGIVRKFSQHSNQFALLTISDDKQRLTLISRDNQTLVTSGTEKIIAVYCSRNPNLIAWRLDNDELIICNVKQLRIIFKTNPEEDLETLSKT